MAEHHVDLASAFPRLAVSPYSVTSPTSPHYNCMAWAAGRDDVWMWPDLFGLFWWPEGVTHRETIDSFVEAFAVLGYETCRTDDSEPGIERVVLFALQERPTHAARQLPDGQWTSKCGTREDIAHELDALVGTTYGEVVSMLRRKS